MDARKGFQRSFMIFVNEDSGYEAGQKPSGYARLEVREGRGKLHATVQNLRPGNGRFGYKLYLLRNSKDGAVTVFAGQLAPELNKAELEWSFDPQNVGVSGYGIEEFDGLVVLVEYVDRPGDTVICPLAAYKNRKVEWRSSLRAEMVKKRMEIPLAEEAIHDNGVNSIESLDRENLFNSISKSEIPGDTGVAAERDTDCPAVDRDACSHAAAQLDQVMQPQMQPQVQPSQTEHMQLQQTDQVPHPLVSDIIQTQQGSENLPSLEQRLQHQISPQGQIPREQPPQEQPQMIQMQTQEALPQHQMQQSAPSQQQSPMELQNLPDVQYQDGLGQIDTSCVYLNGNICGAFVNNGTSAVNPCDACHMHNRQTPMSPAGDVSQLKEEIGRYFEESDPFHIKRSDYLWWKVTNPVNLNNILYQCNIRSPLLFNPAVMMAHYKYRHLIIGIFQQRAGQKQYVVCGVPGMHMVDRKPFGEMSRWVQAEGNRPRYGAFGYWLVYIDPDDGKILNMSQE